MSEFTNHLISEKSPYLLQHAKNPVNWYPWGNEAFERAKKEFDSGEDELLYYEVKKASGHFKNCLNSLGNIKFYQNLTQQELIDNEEFNDLQKSTFLILAKCLLEEGAGLKDVEGDLRKYLALEDMAAGANELKSYLVEKGLIDEKLEESFDESTGDL